MRKAGNDSCKLPLKAKGVEDEEDTEGNEQEEEVETASFAAAKDISLDAAVAAEFIRTGLDFLALRAFLGENNVLALLRISFGNSLVKYCVSDRPRVSPLTPKASFELLYLAQQAAKQSDWLLS